MGKQHIQPSRSTQLLAWTDEVSGTGRAPRLSPAWMSFRQAQSWIGPQIEQYVSWLAGEGYGTRCVLRRVPLVTAFGEFAAANGARQLTDLPEHVSAFTAMRVSQSRDARRAQGDTLAKDICGPVEQDGSRIMFG